MLRVNLTNNLLRRSGDLLVALLVIIFVSISVVGQAEIPRDYVEKEIRIKAESLNFGRPVSELQALIITVGQGTDAIKFQAWRKDFEGGRMYWTPFGARGVRGSILERFNAEGGDKGPFAIPVADEIPCELQGAKSRAQAFWLGVIYWRAPTRETTIHRLTINDIFGSGSAPPCANPIPPADTRPRPGRFRITLTGFSVDKQTSDHILEADGKGDEVFIAAEVAAFENSGANYYSDAYLRYYNLTSWPIWNWLAYGEGINGRGNITFRKSLTSVLMGDEANQEAPRIRAGNAGPTGGFRSGDTYPTNEPWILKGIPSANRLPMLLWEGELRDNGMVMVIPTIWEWDFGHIQPRRDFTEAANLFFKVYTQQNGGFSGWFGTRDVAGAGDRPIGWTGGPAGFKLDLAEADRATQDNFAKHGPGVFDIKYKDEEGAESYTLWVKVERIK